MTSIEQAAELVAGPKVSQASPDWYTILDLLRDIVRTLLNGCLPTPQEAHEYLTKQYGFWGWLTGAEERRDRRIRNLVRDHWLGPNADLPRIQERVVTACKHEVSLNLLAGMYREVGG